MNKLFLVCFAAVLILAGCDSSSLESNLINQDSPQARMQTGGIHPLNANAPDAEMALGKADGAVISNGTIRLGVNQEGNLNVYTTTPYAGYYGVGMQYITPNRDYESTFQGCTCEGWGVADASTGVFGSANDVGGYVNVTRESFITDGVTATSVVTIQNTFRVTHVYTPSAVSANLYEVAVSIENISGAPIGDLRYTRAMDWDIDPTPFSEIVTVQGTAAASAVLYADDNGFADTNPLGSRYPLVPGSVGDFVDSGPSDHGTIIDFGFGELETGASFAFSTFYGAAGSEVDALTALAAVKAEVYSLGQSSTTNGASLGTPATFMFAFKGVGGEVQFPSNAAPSADAGADQSVGAGQLVTLDGSLSSDPDGDTLTYEWRDGNSNLLSTDASFAAGAFNTGTYTFELTVSDGEFSDTDDVTVTVSAIQLLFDIKPDDTNNRINAKNKGVIPTALLGSADFDVTSVDVSTLAFGPGATPEAHGRGHLEDVNDDGFMDLVLHFSTQGSGLVKGDTQGCVVGLTTDGWEVAGCDYADVF